MNWDFGGNLMSHDYFVKEGVTSDIADYSNLINDLELVDPSLPNRWQITWVRGNNYSIASTIDRSLKNRMKNLVGNSLQTFIWLIG